jgi:hypothetical protein
MNISYEVSWGEENGEERREFRECSTGDRGVDRKAVKQPFGRKFGVEARESELDRLVVGYARDDNTNIKEAGRALQPDGNSQRRAVEEEPSRWTFTTDRAGRQ